MKEEFRERNKKKPKCYVGSNTTTNGNGGLNLHMKTNQKNYTDLLRVCYKVKKKKKKYLMRTKARSEPGERREVETVAREEKETTSGTAAINQSG